MKDRRWSEIGKVEAAVKERLRREIVYLQRRAPGVEAKERAGRKPRLNSRNLRRQCEALTDRLELRLADLERQRDVAPLPPEIRGAALIVPAAWLARQEAGAGADPGPEDSADARAEVEAAAMNAVMERERALGHEPRDVSAEDRGYDIESREAGTGRLRFIEVKGRRADARAVTVTRNEMLAAYNARDACILAVAPIERGIAHEPVYLPDPARVFGPEPGFAEVSRAISVEAIRRATPPAKRSRRRRSEHVTQVYTFRGWSRSQGARQGGSEHDGAVRNDRLRRDHGRSNLQAARRSGHGTQGFENRIVGVTTEGGRTT